MSLSVIRWDTPGPFEVAFSMRLGGVSAGPFESLNLGLLTDDGPANVQENRRRLCEAVGAEVERLAMNRQVHVALARENGRPALALLHVGRLGLLEGILEAGVAMLGDRVSAVIGPGIGPCCYEVGDEIADAYRDRFGATALKGRNLDLWSVSERVLRNAGVASIERVDLCTACNPDLFFSHRRDQGVTGRQGVIGYIA